MYIYTKRATLQKGGFIMHFHHIEEILRSWNSLMFAPIRVRQQVAENIQYFARCNNFQFSAEEQKIIQESKKFLYSID